MCAVANACASASISARLLTNRKASPPETIDGVDAPSRPCCARLGPSKFPYEEASMGEVSTIGSDRAKHAPRSRPLAAPWELREADAADPQADALEVFRALLEGLTDTAS